ncbi:MAG: hypothetical protein MZV65_42260 [Chromatiales bacterium]|nr:hypothetical protein [Chromatiales bacterium]
MFDAKSIGLTLLVAAALLPGAAFAAADYSRLGADLTPIGAEQRRQRGRHHSRLGQAACAQPPAGWTPQQGYVDPFAERQAAVHHHRRPTRRSTRTS